MMHSLAVFHFVDDFPVFVQQNYATRLIGQCWKFIRLKDAILTFRVVKTENTFTGFRYCQVGSRKQILLKHRNRINLFQRFQIIAPGMQLGHAPDETILRAEPVKTASA